MSEEWRELMREDQEDTLPDCPFTGDYCYKECRCGECQISYDYLNSIEKNTLNFFMPMIPPTSTKQTRGIRHGKDGKVQFYSRNDGDTEEKLKAHLAQHVPPEPFTGAVKIVCKWCFPIKGKHVDGEPYINKPDVDNLCKSMYDIMTKLGFWRDDKQIYSSVTEKFWADVPGIYVRVEEAQS